MNGRFVLKASGDLFMFNLKAGNNEVILTSERYTAKASALKGIEPVRSVAYLDEHTFGGRRAPVSPLFVLRAANNEVLGTSEMYSSAWARDGGIDAVKTSAPTASVDVQTRP
jgi:uncharacterized protein YegP (UPF0339 family)